MTEQCKFCYQEREKSTIKMQRVIYFIKHPNVKHEQFLEKFLSNKIAKQLTIVVGTHIAKIEFDCKIAKTTVVKQFMEDQTVKLISKKDFRSKNKCLEFKVIEQSNRYIGNLDKKNSLLMKQSILKRSSGEEFFQQHYKFLFDYNNIKRQTKTQRKNMICDSQQLQEFHIIQVKVKIHDDEYEKIELIKQIIKLYKQRSINQKSFIDFNESKETYSLYKDIYNATKQNFQIKITQDEEIQNKLKLDEYSNQLNILTSHEEEILPEYSNEFKENKESTLSEQFKEINDYVSITEERWDECLIKFSDNSQEYGQYQKTKKFNNHNKKEELIIYEDSNKFNQYFEEEIFFDECTDNLNELASNEFENKLMSKQMPKNKQQIHKQVDQNK